MSALSGIFKGYLYWETEPGFFSGILFVVPPSGGLLKGCNLLEFSHSGWRSETATGPYPRIRVEAL
jgi:hypothetical protein